MRQSGAQGLEEAKGGVDVWENFRKSRDKTTGLKNKRARRSAIEIYREKKSWAEAGIQRWHPRHTEW